MDHDGAEQLPMRHFVTLVFALLTPQSPNASPAVGIVDFYGLRSVHEAQVLEVLPYHLGDTIRIDQFKAKKHAVEQQLASIPGVVGASLTLVCCAHGGANEGKSILYVGIEETNNRCPQFEPAPTSGVRLTSDVLAAGENYDVAYEKSVLEGNFSEDDSQGHALDGDPKVRDIQLKFVKLAELHLTNLKDVLHNSSDARERAIAAQVLGYVKDQQAIVPDLVVAMRDADSDVRNNASRALAVFAGYSPNPPAQKINIPAQPFVRMLKSCVWSDRNKSAAALAQISATRDPALLAVVRELAFPALLEMAAWKNLGHAHYSLQILGRIAGLSEDAIQKALAGGDRTPIIEAATGGGPRTQGAVPQ